MKEPVLSKTRDDGREIRVVAADGLWIVLYKDRPFCIATERRKGANGPPIYKRSSAYSRCGLAMNEASRLNRLFGVDDFTVFELTFPE